MRKYLIAAVIFISALTVFCFMTAFVVWELNPAMWSESTRSFIAIFGGWIAAAASGFYLLHKSQTS
jgi:hypothetical protein